MTAVARDPTSMRDLAAGLALEPRGADAFTGTSLDPGRARIFGGLVVAQALVAMARTVERRPIHSLHGYFLLPGDPAEPIAYAVERMRDGGSFSSRRCVAGQHGRPIFVACASFHVPETHAFEHAAEMPVVPAPDDLPSREDIRAGRGTALPDAVRRYLSRPSPIELRPVGAGLAGGAASAGDALRAVWMRAVTPLPDDPAVHAAALAYMSDMTLLDTALVPHGRTVFDPAIQAASLDHALWFHRPARADDWLLFVEDSPNAAGGLGFARGRVFDRSGQFVASSAQEGLLRPRRATQAG